MAATIVSVRLREAVETLSTYADSIYPDGNMGFSTSCEIIYPGMIPTYLHDVPSLNFLNNSRHSQFFRIEDKAPSTRRLKCVVGYLNLRQGLRRRWRNVVHGLTPVEGRRDEILHYFVDAAFHVL